MNQPSRQDIEELVRRLQNGNYPLSDIREAADILVGVQPNGEGYRMALEFATSLHEQVRLLGLCMMEKLAPHIEGARGFLAGAKDAARLLGGAGGAAPGKQGTPDYSAIGEVIKIWLRESRERGGGKRPGGLGRKGR